VRCVRHDVRAMTDEIESPKTEVRAYAKGVLLRSRFTSSRLFTNASGLVASVLLFVPLLSAASRTAPESPVLQHTPRRSSARAVAHLNCGWLVGHAARPWPSRIGRRACVLMTHEQFSSCCFHMVSCPDVLQVSVHVQTGPTEPSSRTARRPERCHQQQPPKPRRIPPRTSPRWLPPSLCHLTAPS